MALLRSVFGSVLHPLLPIWLPLSGCPERQVILFPWRQLPWWHTPEDTHINTHTPSTLLTCFLYVFLPDGQCRTRKCVVSSGQVASLQAGRCHEMSHVKQVWLDVSLYSLVSSNYPIKKWCDMQLKTKQTQISNVFPGGICKDRPQLFRVIFKVRISVQDGELKSLKQ